MKNINKMIKDCKAEYADLYSKLEEQNELCDKILFELKLIGSDGEYEDMLVHAYQQTLNKMEELEEELDNISIQIEMLEEQQHL